MQMTIKEDKKTVEIWVTRQERDDPAFMESLKPIYKKYREQKYLAVVFLSGDEDLYDLTRDLLLFNRRRSVERAANENSNIL